MYNKARTYMVLYFAQENIKLHMLRTNGEHFEALFACRLSLSLAIKCPEQLTYFINIEESPAIVKCINPTNLFTIEGGPGTTIRLLHYSEVFTILSFTIVEFDYCIELFRQLLPTYVPSQRT